MGAAVHRPRGVLEVSAGRLLDEQRNEIADPPVIETFVNSPHGVLDVPRCDGRVPGDQPLDYLLDLELSSSPIMSTIVCLLIGGRQDAKDPGVSPIIGHHRSSPCAV